MFKSKSYSFVGVNLSACCFELPLEWVGTLYLRKGTRFHYAHLGTHSRHESKFASPAHFDLLC